MAGLYIHIPFCESRCIYCGFYSTTLPALRPRYVEALLRELELRRGEQQGPWRTVYLGGGTPSQLEPSQLERLFEAIDISEAVEVTMECNPDDLTDDFCRLLASLPVNRVSMGAQTFSDERLRFLRRRHCAADVQKAVERLRRAGIDNISVDLMYGFPQETMEQWRLDIAHALALGVEHLSAYCLMVEDGTPLFRLVSAGKVGEADEEQCRAMYYELVDRLTAAGYEHYELSNFARPSRRSLHNGSYWDGTPYVGLGAAAHSYDGACRKWNADNIYRYMEGVEKGEMAVGSERLDEATRYNDTVMLRLRTCEGIDLGRLEVLFGKTRLALCLDAARHYVADGLLEHTADGHLRLTRQGLFVSDMVMSDLMDV